MSVVSDVEVSDVAVEEAPKKSTREKAPTVAIHFSEKLVSDPFTSNGKEFVSITVPSDAKHWPSFVVPANKVYDDKKGHGKYTYLLKNASVTLCNDIEKGLDPETGKKTYEQTMEKISVVDLKERFERNPDKDKEAAAKVPGKEANMEVGQENPAMKTIEKEIKNRKSKEQNKSKNKSKSKGQDI